MTNYPDLPSDNFKKDISLEQSNNDIEEIRPANSISDDKNSRLANINK